jgi:hypothetical protein
MTMQTLNPRADLIAAKTHCTICSRPHTECPDCRNHQFCDYCYHCEQHPMRAFAQARAAIAKVQS